MGLDMLLVDAAHGPLRRLIPPAGTALRFGSALARQPGTVAGRAGELAQEVARIAKGDSELAPSKKDKRFADPAWSGNPLLRRAMQLHLATARTAWELIDDADLDWQDDERIRFTATNLVDALAPSNVPVLNPLSLKAVIDTGGRSAVRGLRRFVSRPVDAAAGAVDGRPGRLHGGRGPRRHPGRRRLPDRRVRADPVPADDGDGPRRPAGDGAADDQQVLHRRPRPGPQHRRALRGQRPAGLHDVLAQPGRAARRVGPGHLRPGGPRRDGRRRAGHRQRAGRPPGVLLRRDHHRDGAGPPRRDRAAGPGEPRSASPSPSWTGRGPARSPRSWTRSRSRPRPRSRGRRATWTAPSSPRSSPGCGPTTWSGTTGSTTTCRASRRRTSTSCSGTPTPPG